MYTLTNSLINSGIIGNLSTIIVAFLGLVFNYKIAKRNSKENKELSLSLAEKNAQKALELQLLQQESQRQMEIFVDKQKLYLDITDAIGWIPVNVPVSLRDRKIKFSELKQLKEKNEIEKEDKDGRKKGVLLSSEYTAEMAAVAYCFCDAMEKLEKFDELNRGRFFLYASTDVFNEFSDYLNFLRESDELFYENALKDRSNSLVALLRKSLKVPD